MLLLGLILFDVWRTFNPSDEYFTSLFKTISGLNLPEQSEFLVKNHTEYFVQSEFGSCFIAKVPDSEMRNLLAKSTPAEESQVRGCGLSKKYRFNRKGKNKTDYPFMAWYISKDNLVWAYYEKY